MANERLAALMIQAGFLDRSGTIGRKRFARAVTEAPSARRDGRSYTHTYVGRWLSGMTPRDAATREAIREALGAKLGRLVTLDEVGFRSDATISPDVGLDYPERPDAGVSTVAALLEADLSGVAAVAESGTNVGSWNDVSVSWLVGAQKPLDEGRGPTRMGPSDVIRLRTMRSTFDRLDSTFGGAHARHALVSYLRSELPPLLRAQGDTAVRHELFSVAGELTQLAAWMSYDAGLHGLAQRYFIQALGLADAGEDRLLAASILDAMSHQASFLGRYREAANMARAARLGTRSLAAPLLTAHFHVMEARALARLGEAEQCDRAMSAAVEHFAQHSAGDGPDWLAYFDASELSAELGHCHRDLGRPDRAVEHASAALSAASGDYARSDFFAAMVLADAHLDGGDVDQGCEVAQQAMTAGEGLDSLRCRSYVEEFQQRLGPHRRSPAVRQLVENVGEHRLWKRAKSQ